MLTNPFFLSPGHAHGAGLYFSSPTPRSLCQRPVSTDAMQAEVIGILSARYGRAFLVQIQNYLSDLLPSAPSSPSPSLLPLCSLLLLLFLLFSVEALGCLGLYLASVDTNRNDIWEDGEMVSSVGC